jgi:hypothetical protein
MAACAAADNALAYLAKHGTTNASPVPAYSMSQLHDLMGFPEVWEFEKRFVQAE